MLVRYSLFYPLILMTNYITGGFYFLFDGILIIGYPLSYKVKAAHQGLKLLKTLHAKGFVT